MKNNNLGMDWICKYMDYFTRSRDSIVVSALPPSAHEGGGSAEPGVVFLRLSWLSQSLKGS